MKVTQVISQTIEKWPDQMAVVEKNIQATLKLAGGNGDRWRPHLKTAKIPAVIRMLIAAGVRNVKCSTTLELLVACREGADLD